MSTDNHDKKALTDEAAASRPNWEKEMEANWDKVLPNMLRILESGSELGKKAAREELARMADLANRYVTLMKNGK